MNPLISEQVIVILSLVSFSEDMLNQEGEEEEEEGEAGVELEEVGKIWKPCRDLGGTLITTQVQSSECIRP